MKTEKEEIPGCENPWCYCPWCSWRKNNPNPTGEYFYYRRIGMEDFFGWRDPLGNKIGNDLTNMEEK